MNFRTLLSVLLINTVLSAGTIVGGVDTSSIKKNDTIIAPSVESNAPGLTLLESYTGQYEVSTDGFGSTSQQGIISAMIPDGSTIVKAYLYSAGYSFDTADTINLEGLTFNSVTVAFDKYYENPWNGGYFKTARADVTALVQSVYENESPADFIYNFSIQEVASEVDGEGLVVVYSHPSLPTNTISIIEGGANINGDSFILNFQDPIDKTSETFTFDMYLGISFSAVGQASTINVNNQLLSENAGDNDDGIASNGALMTVGGFNDTYSPPNPTYADDSEKYNLTNYVNTGDTEVIIDTINPSQDDNLFLIVLKSSGASDVTPICDLNGAYNSGFEAGVEHCSENPTDCGIDPKVVVIPL